MSSGLVTESSSVLLSVLWKFLNAWAWFSNCTRSTSGSALIVCSRLPFSSCVTAPLFLHGSKGEPLVHR